MFDGVVEERWNHTAALLSQVANLFKGKKEKLLTPLECHPYRKRYRRIAPQAPPVAISALKVFLPK